MHFLAFGFEQLVLLEAGKYPRYGLHRKAQIVTNFVARHGQAELIGREAAGAEACREVDQECGDAFIGGFLREQQHHLLIVADLAAHNAHQLAAQLRQLYRQLVEALEVRFLANRDANLRFGLLTDFRDAPAESMPEDGPLLEHATRRIDALNAFYRSDAFFLFHRPRRWNPGQRAWYAAKEKTLGDDMKREYPSIPAEAFQQTIEGAYYAKQFTKLYAAQRIGKLPDNSHLPVHTFWDIGVGDSTAIWFVRIVGEEYHVVDFYQNSGEGLRHYMKVLKDRGYTYGEHWGPHDIDNREFALVARPGRPEKGFEGVTVLPVFKSHRVYFTAGRTLEVIDTNDDFVGGTTLLPQAVESHLHQRRSEIKPRRMPAGWTSRFITLTKDLIVDLPCPARVAIFNNGDIFHGPTTI